MAGRGRLRQAHRKLIAVHILTDCVGIQHVLAEDQVNFPLFQSHDAGLVVRNDLDGDLLNGRSLAPVVLVTLKYGVFICDKICEHIGSCADVAVHAVLSAAVDHTVGGDHGKGADTAQLSEHGVVRFAELDDEGITVRRRNSHQQIHHFQPGMPLLVFNDGIEVCQNSIGITQRSIRKINIITDIERVDATVFADGPALCQTALIAVICDTHQGIVENALGIHLTGIQMGVQIPDVPIVDKDQLIFCLSLSTGCGLAGIRGLAATSQTGECKCAAQHGGK